MALRFVNVYMDHKMRRKLVELARIKGAKISYQALSDEFHLHLNMKTKKDRLVIARILEEISTKVKTGIFDDIVGPLDRVMDMGHGALVIESGHSLCKLPSVGVAERRRRRRGWRRSRDRLGLFHKDGIVDNSSCSHGEGTRRLDDATKTTDAGGSFRRQVLQDDILD